MPFIPNSIMKKKVPQYLSSPFQILWFETDDIGIVTALFTLAMIFGGLFWALLIAGPFFYSRVKKKYPRGFMKHLFYFCGLVRLKGYPDYFESEYYE